MTVGDIGIRSMAKRQKTDPSDNGVKCQQKRDNVTDDKPSDEILGTILAATRTPDMNIVDFSDTISDVEVCPEPEPQPNSEIPKRRKKHKRKKKSKHSEDRRADKRNDGEEPPDLDKNISTNNCPKYQT